MDKSIEDFEKPKKLESKKDSSEFSLGIKNTDNEKQEDFLSIQLGTKN